MDITAKKLALFDAHLSHKGLQHLVDVAAELLGNPLFMADMSMGIVFKSSDMGDGEMDYSAEGDLDRQSLVVQKAADAGFLEWIYRNDGAVIGSFPGEPRYLSARVRDGKQVLGHVVAAEVHREFTAVDEELLPVICQTVAFELRRARIGGAASAKYVPLLSELLGGAPLDEETARKRLLSLDASVPATMKVLVFRSFDVRRAISESYLQAQLAEVFLESVGMPFGGGYVHVVDGSLSNKAIATKLRTRVYTGGMGVGVSRAIDRASLLHAAYRQADAALRLAHDSPEGRLVEYDEVAAVHLMELVSAHEPDMGALTLPELKRLQDADERDGSDHVGSLVAYLNNGRNVAKAASELHVHKNSLYYRIARIEEVAGIDLSDEGTCFNLQLSLAMLGMGPSGDFNPLE